MGPSSILLLLGTGVGRSTCPRRSLQEGTGHSAPGWELGSISTSARWSLPGQAVLVLELSRWSTTPRAAIFRSIRHMKRHIWALLHVEAHKFLQRCCLNYLKASCSTKCTGFPVLWGADGVSKKPLQGKWSSDLHHAFPKDTIGLGFLKQQAWIKLQSINVSIQLFQLCRLLFLSCTK